MSKTGAASDGTLGNRAETALTADRVAGSVVDELQHTVGKSGVSGTPLRKTTANENPASKSGAGMGGQPTPIPPFKGKKSSFSKLQMTNQETRELSPRFLVVKRKGGDFANVSPFLIDKVLCSLIGSVSSVRKIREGLLVETTTYSQSQKLLKIEKFYDFEVSVSAHGSLNYTKGVVTCRDLLNCSVTEIVDNLADQGVLDAKRIIVRREGELEETPTLILTFNSTTLPSKIKAGIHILPVRAYIPAPMRCFRCQRFGHTSLKCDKPELCICGKELHVGTPCIDPMKCVNCNGEHSARSRNCPIYKEEAAIQRVKTLEKISFSEARRKVKGNVTTPIAGKSYSQASKMIPTQNINTIDIISNLIPDIVKICVDTIQKSMGITTSSLHCAALNQVAKAAVTSTAAQEAVTQTANCEAATVAATHPMEVGSTGFQDKRKRGDLTPSDNELPATEETSGTEDCNSQNSEFAIPRERKKKPGWPKGRPRKVVE